VTDKLYAQRGFTCGVIGGECRDSVHDGAVSARIYESL
jgi:hypothetical protein